MVRESYSYDPKGNVTSLTKSGTPSTSTSLGWDADNRLTSLTNGSNSATYAYNGSGLRSSKTKNGTTKAFLTDGDSPASALLSDGEATYVPGISERRGSTTNPFHFDLLGSLRAVSNSGGTGTSEATLYEAFGNVVTGETDWAGQTTGRPFGFVGGEQYQSDSESGLQLLGNRYYDPTIGRFLSSDPAEDGDNWYAYCNNNPTGFVDPEGLQKQGKPDKGKKQPTTPKTPTPKSPTPKKPPVFIKTDDGTATGTVNGNPVKYPTKGGWISPPPTGKYHPIGTTTLEQPFDFDVPNPLYPIGPKRISGHIILRSNATVYVEDPPGKSGGKK